MNVNLLVGWLVGWHNNLLHKYIKVHKTARQDEYRMNNLTNIHCKTHSCNEERVFPVKFFSQGITCFHYKDGFTV